jgi:hypothetical protein
VRRFRRRGELIITHLDEYEVNLLTALIGQLIELVQPPEPPRSAAKPDDPLAALAEELESTPVEPPEDPALRRLFPEAYAGDQTAAADFRRFTGHELRAGKVSDAEVVLERLARTEQGSHDLKIPFEEVDAWLRTLTALRLTVGTRLGITDAASADELAHLSDDDPRAFMASVYDWLGFAQETMVEAL